MMKRLAKLRHAFINDFTLSVKFIISFAIAILVPIILISTVSIFVITTNIEKAEQDNQLEQLRTISTNIDYNFGMYIYKSNAVFGNTELQQIIVADYENIYEKLEGYKNISNFLDSINYDVNYVLYNYTRLKYLYESIQIKIYALESSLSEGGRYIFPADEVKEEQWYQETMSSKAIHWHLGTNDMGKEVLYLSRTLINFRNQGIIGVLNIEIPVTIIYETLEQNRNGNDEVLYLFNENKALVTDTFNEETNVDSQEEALDYINNHYGNTMTYTINGDKFIFSGVQSEVTDWYLISVVPLKYIQEGSKQMRVLTMLVAIISVILGVILAVSLRNVIVSRLRKLMNKITKIEENDYEIYDVLDGEDEIAKLDHVFNDMVIEIKRLIEVEYKSKIVRDGTKLELLQEQINPHLLYNTLSTIGYYAKSSGNEEIATTTDSLIRFYRTSLNRGHILISMKQEIEMTKEYIDIMKYTYRLDFDTNLNIDPSVHELCIIKMILQPIVENSIMHGLRYFDGEGCLNISCKKEDGTLIIDVSDNGLGMTQDTIDELLAEEDGEKGYGLRNVIRRIRLYFNEYQDIKITSEPGKGTRVIISLRAMDENSIKNYLKERSLL